MISPRNEIYINSTLAFCPQCRENELARIVARKSGVFMERLCAKNGVSTIKIANDYQWYLDRINQAQYISKTKNARSSARGCPLDCGICEWHSESIRRASFSVGSDNLVYNSDKRDDNTDESHFKNLEDIKKIINHLMENTGRLETISFTGMESLLHPKLFEIIKLLHECGVKKVVAETDGSSGFDDLDFVQKLKESKIHVAFIHDTLDPPKSITPHGKDVSVKKIESLQILESYQIPTELLLLHCKGINDEKIPDLVQEYISKEFVRNIVILNQLFNGSNKLQSSPQVPATIDEVENVLARAEMISQKDFISHPHCHPLCSSVAYYIVHGRQSVALSRILNSNDIKGVFERCCTPSSVKDFSRKIWDGVNRFWSDGDNQSSVNVLREFVREIYPAGKMISDKKIWENAEKMTKGVYIHQYMDESNFDINRVSRCGDVFIDNSDRIMPVCSHYLIHH